jgi:hypothetical protein
MVTVPDSVNTRFVTFGYTAGSGLASRLPMANEPWPP